MVLPTFFSRILKYGKSQVNADYLRCMGTTAGHKDLEINYPLAFGNAFSKTLEKRFRYIHLSGATTERDQEKPLWFKAEMRKMKVRKSSAHNGFPVFKTLLKVV